MTFAESLRKYADWCEANPELAQDGIIYTYGETTSQAKAIMLSDPQAKLDLSPANEILYLRQEFGELTVEHVLYKHDVCDLAIVDNKVVAVLKPEFAELRTASLADVAPGWVTP